MPEQKIPLVKIVINAHKGSTKLSTEIGIAKALEDKKELIREDVVKQAVAKLLMIINQAIDKKVEKNKGNLLE